MHAQNSEAPGIAATRRRRWKGIGARGLGFSNPISEQPSWSRSRNADVPLMRPTARNESLPGQFFQHAFVCAYTLPSPGQKRTSSVSGGCSTDYGKHTSQLLRLPSPDIRLISIIHYG